MNADDRGPAGEAKPPFRPVSGDAPVRREGFMPPSGSVPQRTAFRSVTGTTPTTAQPGAQAQPSAQPSAQPLTRPGTYAPPAHQGAQGAPQSAPRVSAPEPSPRPAAGGAPSPFTPTSGAPRTGAPTAFAPTTDVPATGTPGTVAPAAGAPAAVASAARSAASAIGIGRLKGVATERVKANDAKTPVPGAPRKARVLLSRIDPWSALKIGFLVAIAFGIMTVVSVDILWRTLNEMQTFVTIQEWVSKLFTQDQEVNILQFFEYRKVMPATLLIAVVNVVLISGLSVISAFIYNMISRVVGGVYVTLTDD